MDRLSSSSLHQPNRAPQRGGFTLLEILVAVAIMSLLLTIIMVPLRLAFDSFHTGTARSAVQQAAQASLKQISDDLRKAQFVFPNSFIPGVNDSQNLSSSCSTPEYKNGGTNNNDWRRRPYIISDDPNTGVDPSVGFGVCSPLSTGGTSGVRAWDNLARIDMLQLRRNDNGTIPNSSAGQDYIVSYYTRRLIYKADSPFDIVDNPVVLFRAQIPFRLRSIAGAPGAPFKVPNQADPNFNAQIDWTQYPDSIGTCSGAPLDRDFQWITHNFFGEANLEPLTIDTHTPTGTTTVAGAHTLAIPRGMGLVTPRSNTITYPPTAAQKEALVPDISFQEEATAGRIDRVTISMTLAQYDTQGNAAVNGQPAAQRVRVSQTVELPNVGCSP